MNQYFEIMGFIYVPTKGRFEISLADALQEAGIKVENVPVGYEKIFTKKIVVLG